jgi:hypothetical protein
LHLTSLPKPSIDVVSDESHSSSGGGTSSTTVPSLTQATSSLSSLLTQLQYTCTSITPHSQKLSQLTTSLQVNNKELTVQQSVMRLRQLVDFIIKDFNVFVVDGDGDNGDNGDNMHSIDAIKYDINDINLKTIVDHVSECVSIVNNLSSDGSTDGGTDSGTDSGTNNNTSYNTNNDTNNDTLSNTINNLPTTLTSQIPPSTLTTLQRIHKGLSKHLLSSFKASSQANDIRRISTIVPLLSQLNISYHALECYMIYIKAILDEKLGKCVVVGGVGGVGGVDNSTDNSTDNANKCNNSIASILNASSTIIRHHLPMISNTMGTVNGDAALIQLVHLSVEEHVIKIIDKRIRTIEDGQGGGQGSGQGRRGRRDVEEMEDFLMTYDQFPVLLATVAYPRPVVSARAGNQGSTGATKLELEHSSTHSGRHSEASMKDLLKDLDVNTEMNAALIQYNESYLRFINHCCEQVVQSSNNSVRSVDEILPKNGLLNDKIIELAAVYSKCENELFINTVLQVFNMNDIVYDDIDNVSNIIEDIFFVSRRSTVRSIATGNVICVCVVFNYNVRILQILLFDILAKKRLKKSIDVILDCENSKKELRTICGSTFNDFERGRLYLKSLINTIQVELTKAQIDKNEQVVSSLESLTALEDQMTAEHPLVSLFDGLKPTIKTLVENAASGHSYDLSEENEGGDYVSRICSDLEVHVGDRVMGVLQESLRHDLWSLVVAEVCKRLEIGLRRKVFSDIGALKFDSDLRSLVGWCKGRITVTTHVIGLERLRQISRIVNVYDLGDVVGVVEGLGDEGGGGGDGGKLLLKKSEVRGYLKLKKEFDASDVDFVVDRLVIDNNVVS